MRRKIFILVNNLRKGGAERVVSLLIRYLSKNPKVDVKLVLLQEGVEYEIPSNVKVSILSSKILRSPLVEMLLLPYLAYKLSILARKNKIDMILSFLYKANYVNVLSKYFGFRGKSIISVRSNTSRYFREGIKGLISLFLIKKLFIKADAIISNSFGVKEDLEKLIGRTENHFVIPNPIDISNINILKEKNIDNLRLDERFSYIVSVGRLVKLKRQKDLILAFSKIHKFYPNLRLLFIGDGYMLPNLKKLSKRLGLDERIIFLGKVNNPFYFIAKSKIFVLTSEIEGFPNSLVEAMACGLPVISSNCNFGPSEILDNGKYGLLFKVGDINKLAYNIKLLLDNQELYKKFSDLAYKRACDFEINRIIPQYEEVLML